MKSYSITKEKSDYLEKLFSIFKEYQIITNTMQKEISTYIVGEIFPDIGLKAEDFKFTNVDLTRGVVDFDDVKQKEMMSKEVVKKEKHD